MASDRIQSGIERTDIHETLRSADMMAVGCAAIFQALKLRDGLKNLGDLALDAGEHGLLRVDEREFVSHPGIYWKAEINEHKGLTISPKFMGMEEFHDYGRDIAAKEMWSFPVVESRK